MSQQDRAAQLQSYFEQSSTVMRRAVEHVDEAYTKPGMDRVGTSFDRRPISTTFLAIFAFLSLIPVLFFVGFAVFVFGLFLSLAICTALAAFFAVILVAGGLLACTLLLLLCVAAFLTSAALGTLVAGRLVYYMRQDGLRGGLVAWAQEMRSHLLPSSVEQPADEPEDIAIKDEQNAHSKDVSDTSSAVVVEAVTDSVRLEDVKAE
ncbi:hypothetical protein PsYK624_023760 [Phanerochaete sordida]|uniref:Uncharacterized protein n=1 Tax=Phanerochaete sordida TaxID=48140 RepID=A0A9P3G147_9APHY|nr:hypothetical protein PsYK624_023760 [Phanerochaete sordida]